MRKILFSIALAVATVPAMAGEPITLRDMGSFHVGGRVVEITGKPVKELVLGAGGVPAELVIVKKAGHGFLPAGGPINPSLQELIQIVVKFLNQNLKGKP